MAERTLLSMLGAVHVPPRRCTGATAQPRGLTPQSTGSLESTSSSGQRRVGCKSRSASARHESNATPNALADDDLPGTVEIAVLDEGQRRPGATKFEPLREPGWANGWAYVAEAEPLAHTIERRASGEQRAGRSGVGWDLSSCWRRHILAGARPKAEAGPSEGSGRFPAPGGRARCRGRRLTSYAPDLTARRRPPRHVLVHPTHADSTVLVVLLGFGYRHVGR
jgi:hypothetical protein